MSKINLNCPVPHQTTDRIQLAHGGGGRLMSRLIHDVLAPFRIDQNEILHDAALLETAGQLLAYTTDSFVVTPHTFPGGDIGSLAIHGTVNDLAMSGARPLALSCGFILEEGFPLSDLERIVQSMATTAEAAGVRIVTGDTKVVERGRGDGIYINTSGIGGIEHELRIIPEAIEPGDGIIVSGDIGRHGVAIMATRSGLSFESTIESDAGNLWPPVSALLSAGINIHCLRDLTRGGLASALVELTDGTGLGMALLESDIPVHPTVQGACELLGFDPLHVANEGRMVLFVPQAEVNEALLVLQNLTISRDARQIGKVNTGPARVTIKGMLETERYVEMFSGEQLPRIC